MSIHFRKLGQVWRDVAAQDLIEYALLLALIALGVTAGMGAVARAISAGFADIGNRLSTYTTWDDSGPIGQAPGSAAPKPRLEQVAPARRSSPTAAPPSSGR